MKNIVLIGMPSSGKSTVGAILSHGMGLPFYDSDHEILSRIGMPIADYFAHYGEASFRKVESEVIAELSKKADCIIATGGGAILAKENVDALKQTGTLVFLDRPLHLLLTTDDRPLSRDREALEALYRARYPRYLAACDLHIDADADPDSIAREIRKELEL